MTDNILFKIAGIAGIAVILGGCAFLGEGETGEKHDRVKFYGNTNDNGKLFGDDGSSLKGLLSDGGDENALPVNKYLWRGSLDTLSFLPLASTDPFSGVIATEWGASPDAPNERVRVTAYVEGKELTSRALDVSVFRETLNPSGAWVAASVSPQTAEQLKDKILLRARELRIQDVDGSRV